MGTDKAWLAFGDEFLLQRVVRVMRDVVDPIVVVAAEGQQLPPLPDNIEVVRDLHLARGPLEGMRAGFLALAGKAPQAYVTSCDAPFLSADFVTRVVSRLGDMEIAAPRIAGRWQPLSAVYRIGLLDRIEAMLDEDRRRGSDLLSACQTRAIEASEFADIDPALNSLRSCNTPEEYQQALLDAAMHPSR
jgi:molybdenum cofactor guanylyltransferase